MSSVDIWFRLLSYKCFIVNKTLSTHALLQEIENKKESEKVPDMISMNLIESGNKASLQSKKVALYKVNRGRGSLYLSKQKYEEALKAPKEEHQP